MKLAKCARDGAEFLFALQQCKKNQEIGALLEDEVDKIHWFIDSIVRGSLVQRFRQAVRQSVSQSFSHAVIQSFIHSFVHSFIH
jgi:hypothetical protein